MSEEIHTVIGTVDEKGKFIVPEEMKKDFRWLFLRHAGYKVVVSVKRWRDRRSLKQNSYYHAVVVRMIGDAMGEDDYEEVHDMLKAMHNKVLIIGKDNQEAYKPRSTAKLDTKEMAEYIERCCRWAASFLDLNIPPPNRAMVGGGGI